MTASIKDLERELWLRHRERDEIKWQTKDGDKISIRNMSDEHLLNAIRHCCKQEALSELACEYEAYINDLD